MWPRAVVNVLAPEGRPTVVNDEVHADFLRKCGKLARRAAKAAAPKNGAVVRQGANAQPCVLAKSPKPIAADGNGNVPSAPASTPANARAASNAPRTRVFAGARDDSGATAHSNANAQLLCVPAKSFTPNAREGHIPTTEHHTNTPPAAPAACTARRTLFTAWADELGCASTRQGGGGGGGGTTADSCCSNDTCPNSTAASGVAVHTAPHAVSRSTPNAAAAVFEVTRVLTTHSTDELFVLLQILGKYLVLSLLWGGLGVACWAHARGNPHQPNCLRSGAGHIQPVCDTDAGDTLQLAVLMHTLPVLRAAHAAHAHRHRRASACPSSWTRTRRQRR